MTRGAAVCTPYPPISDYALIGDCQSAALVSRDGSVDWCCLRRFDARPVFARQLDWERGGHFRVAPIEPYTVTRAYRPSTNVLETRFETEHGSLVLVDCLAMCEDHDERCDDQLSRLVRCERGLDQGRRRVPAAFRLRPHDPPARDARRRDRHRVRRRRRPRPPVGSAHDTGRALRLPGRRPS